jgi:hypothetical protein
LFDGDLSSSFGNNQNEKKDGKNKNSKKIIVSSVITVCLIISGVVAYILLNNGKSGNGNEIKNTPGISVSSLGGNNGNGVVVETDDEIKKTSTTTSQTPKETITLSDKQTSTAKITAKKTTSVTNTIKPTIQSGPVNLLTNNGAESDGTNWYALYSGSSTGEHSYTTEDKYEGSKSFKIVKTNSVNCHFFYQRVSISGGGTFVYSLYLKLVGVGTNKGCGAWIDYYDPDGTYHTIKPALLKGSSGWQYMTASVSIPSNITAINLVMGIYDPGTVYFDKVILTKN